MNKLAKIAEISPAVDKRRRTKYLKELQRLESEYGVVTPRTVVDSAKDPDSPLHRLFDWDDKTAADKYRLMRARLLMTEIKVEIGGRETAGFINTYVVVNDVPTRGYISTAKALSDEEITKQLIAQGIHEIEFLTEKYKNYQELSALINQKKLELLKQKIDS